MLLVEVLIILDPILRHWDWYNFSAKWLETQRLRELKGNPSTTTIYTFFTNEKNTPLNGTGSYSLDEILHLAGKLNLHFCLILNLLLLGLPPWLLARNVFASPEMFGRLMEAFHCFVRERRFTTKYVRLASACVQWLNFNQARASIFAGQKCFRRFFS